MNKRTYWALGIDKGHDKGTETIETFVLLPSAVDALNKLDNNTAFIDQWVFSGHCDKQFDQFMTKQELNKILNKTFICEE